MDTVNARIIIIIMLLHIVNALIANRIINGWRVKYFTKIFNILIKKILLKV